MPSGAKKRKAAKKKKQVQAIEPPARSTGEEDLKRDDKESDSEGSSPASQDYQNHQNQFTEREVEDGEKQLDDSHDQSIDENESNGVKHESKEVEIVGNEEVGLVHVERELKVEGESESQEINVEDAEPMIESYRGGLQRSSSSSSSSVEEYADKNNVVVDDAPAVELVREIESSPDKNTIVVDDAPAVELMKHIESLPDKNSIVVDDAPTVELVKDNESLSDKQVTDCLGTSASDLDKAAISEDTVQVTISASDVDSVTISAVGPVVKDKGEENLLVVAEKDTASDTVVENWEENLGAIVDKATISEVLTETGSEKRDEAASAISNGNSLENTDAKASATPENEETVQTPHSAPKIDASVCADNAKESPALECRDHQITALPSRPVQTTSWKSCCGLFELFTGSNR